MTVVIELEPEIESLLKKRAKDQDCDLNVYVKKLIEKDIDRKRTFDEILAPVRQSIEQSELSSNELDFLFTEARNEVYYEKKRKDTQEIDLSNG